MLDPPQGGAKNRQAGNIEAEDGTHGNHLAAHLWEVEDPEGDEEERQVADEEDEPGRRSAPPGVFPGEGAGSVEEDLDEDAKDGTHDGKEKAVGDAEEFLFFIGREHFGEGDAGDGEHEADFDVQPDEDEESGAARGAPHGGMIGEVKDKPVPDFVEPVHAPERQPGKHQAPVAAFNLDGVDVDDEGKEGDDVPFELGGVA